MDETPAEKRSRIAAAAWYDRMLRGKRQLTMDPRDEFTWFSPPKLQSYNLVGSTGWTLVAPLDPLRVVLTFSQFGDVVYGYINTGDAVGSITGSAPTQRIAWENIDNGQYSDSKSVYIYPGGDPGPDVALRGLRIQQLAPLLTFTQHDHGSLCQLEWWARSFPGSGSLTVMQLSLSDFPTDRSNTPL